MMLLAFLLPLAAYGMYPASPTTCADFSGPYESNGYLEYLVQDRCVGVMGNDGISRTYVSKADGSGVTGFGGVDYNVDTNLFVPNDGYTSQRPANGVANCLRSWMTTKNPPVYGPWRMCPVSASAPGLKDFDGVGSGLGPRNYCPDASGDYEDNAGDMLTLEQEVGRCVNVPNSDGAFMTRHYENQAYTGSASCTDCFMRGDRGMCDIMANKDISCHDGYTMTYKGPVGTVNVQPIVPPTPPAACSDYDNDKKGCKKPAGGLTCKFTKLKSGMAGYDPNGPKKQGACVAVAAPACSDETSEKKCGKAMGGSCCWDGQCRDAGTCNVTCAVLGKKTCENNSAGLTCHFDKKAGMCKSGSGVTAGDPCLSNGTSRSDCKNDRANGGANSCTYDRKRGCVTA